MNAEHLRALNLHGTPFSDINSTEVFSVLRREYIRTDSAFKRKMHQMISRRCTCSHMLHVYRAPTALQNGDWFPKTYPNARINAATEKYRHSLLFTSSNIQPATSLLDPGCSEHESSNQVLCACILRGSSYPVGCQERHRPLW